MEIAGSMWFREEVCTTERRLGINHVAARVRNIRLHRNHICCWFEIQFKCALLPCNWISFPITLCPAHVWHCMLRLEERRISMKEYGDSQHRCVTDAFCTMNTKLIQKYSGNKQSCIRVTSSLHYPKEYLCLVTIATRRSGDYKWLCVITIRSFHFGFGMWTISFEGKMRTHIWNTIVGGGKCLKHWTKWTTFN